MSDTQFQTVMVGDFVRRVCDFPAVTTYGRVTEVASDPGRPGRCRVRSLGAGALDWYETPALVVTLRPKFPEGTRVVFADQWGRPLSGTVHEVVPDTVSALCKILPDDHDPGRPLAAQLYYRAADTLTAAPAPPWAPKFKADDRVTVLRRTDRGPFAGVVCMVPAHADDCYGVMPDVAVGDDIAWCGEADLTPAPPPAADDAAAGWVPKYKAGDAVTRTFGDGDVWHGTVLRAAGRDDPDALRNGRFYRVRYPNRGQSSDDLSTLDFWSAEDSLQPAAPPTPAPAPAPAYKYKAGDAVWCVPIRQVVVVTGTVNPPDHPPHYRTETAAAGPYYCGEPDLAPVADPAFPVGSAVLLPDGRRCTVTWAPHGPGAKYTVDPGGGLGTRDVEAADLRPVPTPRSVLAARPPGAVFLRYAESDGNVGVVIPTGVVAAEDTGEDLLAGVLVHLKEDHGDADDPTPAGWQFTEWYLWAPDLAAAEWVAEADNAGFFARVGGLVHLGRLLAHRRGWKKAVRDAVGAAGEAFTRVPPLDHPEAAADDTE